MNSIETRLKSLAISLGADLVGITTTKALSDGPPSADPRYLFCRSVCVPSRDERLANRKLIINSGTAGLKLFLQTR